MTNLMVLDLEIGGINKNKCEPRSLEKLYQLKQPCGGVKNHIKTPHLNIKYIVKKLIKSLEKI
jgi:hypothetical protein